MAVDYSNHATVCSDIQLAVMRFVESIKPPGCRLLVFTQWHDGIHSLCGNMRNEGGRVFDSYFGVRCRSDNVCLISTLHGVRTTAYIPYSDPALFDQLESAAFLWFRHVPATVSPSNDSNPRSFDVR